LKIRAAYLELTSLSATSTSISRPPGQRGIRVGATEPSSRRGTPQTTAEAVDDAPSEGTDVAVEATGTPESMPARAKCGGGRDSGAAADLVGRCGSLGNPLYGGV
jgi:hypothetical protein